MSETTPKVSHRVFDDIGLDKFTAWMDDLNERTRMVYLRNTKLIKQLLDEKGWTFNSYGELFYFMRNEGFFNFIIKTLEESITNNNTKKGRFNTLIKVNQFLKHVYKNQMETSYYVKNLQVLSVKLADITIEINKKLATQKKNEKEQVNMCELEKLQEKVKEIKEDQWPNERLLIHLYTFLPARRGEYNKMRVVYRDGEKANRHETFDKINWYDTWDNKFYFNNQKNKQKSVINGTEEIAKLIKQMINNGIRTDDGTKQIYTMNFLYDESQSQYSKMVKRVFKKYTQLSLTPNLLRKMWVVYSQKQTAEKQIELASQMGHSIAVAKKHYNKVD